MDARPADATTSALAPGSGPEGPAPEAVTGVAPVIDLVIVGAGSLGLAFGAALARAGHVVTVLARPASAAALLQRGTIEVSGQLSFTVPAGVPPSRPGQVAVVGHAVEIPEADALVFTTKGQDLPSSIEEVASTWLERGRDGAFVAGMQNGVLKDDLLAEAFGRSNVVGAASVLGARRSAPGAVSVTGVGSTYVGEFGTSTSTRTEAVAGAFRGAGLPCHVMEDIRDLLWTKFCNAIGVFGVTAVTGLPTIEIFARRPLSLAFRSLIEEAAAVAAAEGARVCDFPDLPIRTYLEQAPEEMVAQMARRAGPPGSGPRGFSSMAQDLEAGRPTEIDETFGDLVRRAASHGVEVPSSLLVYRFVQGLEVSGPTDRHAQTEMGSEQ
jgi:2-dehydropantoate 2-reductase